MRNEHLTGTGFNPKTAVQQVSGFASVRMGVFQKALSVLLSVLLVVTMSPLSGDVSVIARATEGTDSAAAASDDGVAQGSQGADQNAPENENAAGGGAHS